MFVHETLTIDKLHYYPGLNNTVCAVQYTYTFDNLVDSESKFTKVVALPLPQSNFVPYENLTEEMIKQWIIENDKDFEFNKQMMLSELLDTQGSQNFVNSNNLPWNN